MVKIEAQPVLLQRQTLAIINSTFTLISFRELYLKSSLTLPHAQMPNGMLTTRVDNTPSLHGVEVLTPRRHYIVVCASMTSYVVHFRQNWTSFGNNFGDFPENQPTKFGMVHSES